MIIQVKVVANAKEEGVEFTSQNSYKVRVKEQALQGKANEAVKRLLGAHFHVKPSSVIIRFGERSPHKLIEIRD